jgi:hypothetical protein
VAPAPGRLVIALYHRERHGKNVLVGRAAVTFRHAGAARVKLVLTRRGRRLLRAKRLTVTARASFARVGQRTTSATSQLTLKR